MIGRLRDTPWVVIGAIVAFLFNALFAMMANPKGAPFAVEAPRLVAGDFTPMVLTAIFVTSLFAAISRRGIAFAAGATGMILALSVLSLGWATKQWLDPINIIRREMYLADFAAKGAAKQAAGLASWQASIRAKGMNRAAGVGRMLIVRKCALTHRDSIGRLPRDSAELTTASKGCRGYLSQDSQQEQYAWKWRYARGTEDAQAHTVTVEPAPGIGLAGPILSVDERGMLLERAVPGAQPMFIDSPVAILRAVRECLDAASPAVTRATDFYLEKMTFRLGYCDTVDVVGIGNVSGLDESLTADRDNTVLRRMAGMEARPGVVPAPGITGYGIVLVRRPGGAQYDLLARPFSYPIYAVRNYLLSAEGTLHVTAENRAATRSDPPPHRCEQEPVPCVD